MTIMNSFHIKRRAVRKFIQYWLMRHVIPLNDGEREISENGNRIFVNSLPKSGTNLVRNLITQLPCVISRWTYHIDESIDGFLDQLATVRVGQAVTSHMPWTQDLESILNEGKFKKILMVRDPRDIAVSGCHYVSKLDKSHLLHEYFNSIGSREERLLRYIEGVADEHYPGGRRPKSWGDRHSEGFLPWIDDAKCLVVKFEELIGPKGGGNLADQRQSVESIIEHLGLKSFGIDVEHLCNFVFSPKARTFRRGQIGSWRQEFNDGHKRAFNEKHGDLLIRLGYEDNFHW